MDVSDPTLHLLGVERSSSGYLRDLWERREFAVVVPANDIRAQNMDTLLGQMWHILNPAALVAVYWLVFDVLLKTSRGIDNYLGFLVVGILFFQLTQRVILDGAIAIPRNEGLIRSIQFPRALLPISSLTGQTIAFLPALLVMAVTLCLTGAYPTWRWFMVIPVLVAQALINLAGGLVMARLGATVRDLREILPHLMRLLFYVSGILFSVERVIANETVVSLMALNPIYSIVSAARWSLLGADAGSEIWLSLVLWSVITPWFALRFFRAHEHRYGA